MEEAGPHCFRVSEPVERIRPKSLLPRLHGFELMMAPYAIAHMKVGLKLFETGYRFESDARARVYLTNSLEEAVDDNKQMSFAEWVPALAHEAQAVNRIKRHHRFTVVIGNPPYSGHSTNVGDWITNLVDDYYIVDGNPLGEKNPKWLQDDYVKFIRLGEYYIVQAGRGVHSYISNHGYIDNPTFRGMRQHLMHSFDAIEILDLHGNSTKKERSPDGTEDQNVFEIKQGVAIFAARRSSSIAAKTSIAHADEFGQREFKYSELIANTFHSLPLRTVQPATPFYLFLPQNLTLREEYARYPSISEVMPVNVLGFQTHRDHFAIDIDRTMLLKRIIDFRETGMTDAKVAEVFDLKNNRDWTVHSARKQLRNDQSWKKHLIQCAYRPLDWRPCYFSTVAMDYPRREMLDHVANRKNLCLGLGRQGIAVQDPVWSLVAISKDPVDANIFRRGGINVFPLWLYAQEGQLSLAKDRQPNFAPDFGNRLAKALGTRVSTDGDLPAGFVPEDVAHYAFGVFYSRAYRLRYAEFLKIDFPRLPLPGSLDLFRALARLGGELVALHLFESPKLSESMSAYSGPKAPRSINSPTHARPSGSTRSRHAASRKCPRLCGAFTLAATRSARSGSRIARVGSSRRTTSPITTRSLLP